VGHQRKSPSGEPLSNQAQSRPAPKQLFEAVATIDFAILKQNQCCFELQV